ncbi:MAG TPA: ABC transporter substrate-binding protein [Solirubrobacterales bacterium]|nr:ABC transporter substrate-binding protein [Solirubrobacterales bacterium]
MLTALLAGCGGGGGSTERTLEHPRQLTPLRVTLDGWDRPETAGILMAEKLGYFADANLEVTTFRPATPSRPVEYVVDGTDDIGISHLPQVVLAKEKGAPVVALGSLLSQPTMAMIWLRRSKIRNIADLEGKTIGIPGLSFEELFLRSFLARGGLTLRDVKVKRVWYNAVPRLVEGDVDAIFGVDWNTEGVRLETRGLHPVITQVQSLGFPAYDELVVIARSDRLAEHPLAYRAFISAISRGATAAIEHPEEMVEVLEEDVNANPERSRKEAKAEVMATLPMLSGVSRMSSGQARALMQWMREEGMTRRIWPASGLFDNEFLDSQG